MEFVLATIIFPLLVFALATGTGLLVDRVAGGAIPGVLIPPVGLAGLVVVAELFGWQAATGTLAPLALVIVAIAGYVIGWGRLKALRPNWWAIAAAVGAYVMVCAPVLLAGRVTIGGYLLDTTVGFHLLGSDYLLEHGRDFSDLPPSTYRLALEAYFGTQYPSGGHTLLGAAGRLVGVDRIWLYQPFISLLLAFCAPVIYFIARAADLPRPLAAATGVLASAPALVYAYAQMGAIKELTALPFVLLLGAVLVMLPRLLAIGPRAAIVPAVIGAAGVGAIGLAFLPWVGATAVAAVGVMMVGPRDARPSLRPLLVWTAVLGLALVLLALPTFGPLSESLRLAESFSTSNQAAVNDPGNLLRPLKPEQMLGVWLTGSHRVDPAAWLHETYVLIGVALLAALLGFMLILRRRLWPLVAWTLASALVWVVLTRRGTAWTDAKLLVIASPVAVLLAAFGVASLWRLRRRVEAAAIGAVLAFGILASNAFTYHDTNLLPTDRYEELIQVGERFHSEKPTLLPEFDEFALYALQDLPPDGPGFAFKTEPIALLADGSPTAYGQSYDLDQLSPEAVDGYDTIVTRRRPDSSRPPASFKRVFNGSYYDVWRKRRGVDVVRHLPAGTPDQPAGHVPCDQLREAVDSAGPDEEIRFVERRRLVRLDPTKAKRSPGWLEGQQGIGLYTPGQLSAKVKVPTAGRYRVWLEGSVSRELRVYVNGEPVGAVSYESGNAGNYALSARGAIPGGAQPHPSRARWWQPGARRQLAQLAGRNRARAGGSRANCRERGARRLARALRSHGRLDRVRPASLEAEGAAGRGFALAFTQRRAQPEFHLPRCHVPRRAVSHRETSVRTPLPVFFVVEQPLHRIRERDRVGFGVLDSRLAPKLRLGAPSGEVHARKPAGHHLLRKERVVGQREAEPNGGLGIAQRELVGRHYSELLMRELQLERFLDDVSEEDHAHIRTAAQQLLEGERAEGHGPPRGPHPPVEHHGVAPTLHGPWPVDVVVDP